MYLYTQSLVLRALVHTNTHQVVRFCSWLPSLLVGRPPSAPCVPSPPLGWSSDHFFSLLLSSPLDVCTACNWQACCSWSPEGVINTLYICYMYRFRVHTIPGVTSPQHQKDYIYRTGRKFRGCKFSCNSIFCLIWKISRVVNFVELGCVTISHA